jgi:hypothetical protein
MRPNDKYIWRRAFVREPPLGAPLRARLALNMIFSASNKDGCGCCVTQKTFAFEFGVSRDTVLRSVKAAVRSGWLIVRKIPITVPGTKVAWRNEYEPAIPDGVPLPEARGRHPDAHSQGSEVHIATNSPDKLVAQSNQLPRELVADRGGVGSKSGVSRLLIAAAPSQNHLRTISEGAPSPSPAETAGSAAPRPEAEAAAAPPRVGEGRKSEPEPDLTPQEYIRHLHAKGFRVREMSKHIALSSMSLEEIAAEVSRLEVAKANGGGGLQRVQIQQPARPTTSAAAPEASPPSTVTDGWCLTLSESASVVSVSTVTLH